jgi:YfiH family protein
VCAANLRAVVEDFAPGSSFADMRQVHGSTVDVVEDRRTSVRPEADALVSTRPDTVLVVRVADCVPVLLADPDAGVVAAVHAGRPGLVAGVAPAAVARMRDLGARTIVGWLGPRVCGACYEVPEEMQADVAALVPAARATTSWGTPSLDIGAGVRAQLETAGVTVHDVGTCTRESTDLYSYRRDGAQAGRFAGLIRRHR